MAKKNKLTFFFIFLFALIFPFIVRAGGLTCWDIDGMSIFGYKYDEYIYIGSIANEFSGESIANEFGWGNEFKSNSIMNDFGKFGSEFSSYSAFNEFASTPPIIVNRNNEFVGYLTVNDFKTPSINTYKAIQCAGDSFRSSIRGHEDIIFKDIPGRSSYFSGEPKSMPDLENMLEDLCPPNSQYSNGQCICRGGYVASGNICITYTQNCQNKYGLNAYGDIQHCYCSAGYEFNSSKTICIKSVICPDNSTRNGQRCLCNEGYTVSGNSCIKVMQKENLNNKPIQNLNDNTESDNEKNNKGLVQSKPKTEIKNNNEGQKNYSMIENITKKDNNEVKKEKVGFVKNISNFLASISNSIKTFFGKIFR